MRTTVRKWGSSLAVRIPKPLALGAGLRPGAEVELLLENGTFLLMPARRRWQLSRLLSRVTQQNLHAEVEFRKAKGREAW